MSAALESVTAALQEIAPLELAEEWDNVGLLIEPSKARPIRRVLLTIDLTDAVLDEAIKQKSDLIVAYHPPIFHPIKNLKSHALFSATQRRAVRVIEHGITVYSPHTALDAVPGGVNDWLCDGLGEGRRTAWKRATELAGPLRFKTKEFDERYKLVVFVPPEHADSLRQRLANAGAGRIGEYFECSFNLEGIGMFRGSQRSHPTVGKKGRLERVPEVRMEMVCGKTTLPLVLDEIREHHPYEEPAFDVYKLEPKPLNDTGQGRLKYLDKSVSLSALVARVKKHLNLRQVRVAAPLDVRSARRLINEIGVCAGAGGSLFEGTIFQAYLTGEMRHHDVLEKVEQGSTVILCDHTHTERGYLPVLRKKLHEKLGRKVRIDISKADREPLQIV
jgi:dinuclear metal center YbgI/SA1388 family protein